MTSFEIMPLSPSRARRRARRPSAETWLSIALWGAGASGLAIVAMVLIVVLAGSWQALVAVGPVAFVSGTDWFPTQGAFSLVPMMLGTIAVSVGALALALPLALLSAIYVAYYANAGLASAFRLVLQTLAGIPSVVYGLWGLAVLVPLIAAYEPPGASLLAGIIVLAIMILPTIAVVAEAALRQLPPAYYWGGLALGLPRWSVIVRIILPAARGPLGVAAVLGLARALGETMAVLMVTGNAVAVPDSLFASIRTLPSNIALEMAYAMDVHRSALFATGLVLLALVFALLMAVRAAEVPHAR